MSFDCWAGFFIGMLLGVVIYLVLRPIIKREPRRELAMNAFVLIFCSALSGACQEIPMTWPWMPHYCGEVITAGVTNYGRGVIIVQCPIEGQGK